MRFIDLFAGLGGFHLAAAQLGMHCVFASEIDERLRRLYHLNFGILPAGDVFSVDPADVPSHDLLCAGFPCQPFSKAGDQLGWKDRTRGTVFYRVIDILRHHRPKLVLLENVAHFVRHDSGNTYRCVVESLEGLGYTVQYRQLSPHQFGVPQIRERMYMVAALNGLDGFVWPEPELGPVPSVSSFLDTRPANAHRLSQQSIACIKVWQDLLRRIPKADKLPSFPIWSMEFGATYPTDRDSLDRVPLPELRQSRGVFGEPLAYRFRSEIDTYLPSHAKGAAGVFPTWKRAFIRQNREFYTYHERQLRDWIPSIRTFPPSLQKLEWNCQGDNRNLWQYILQFRASGLRVKRPTTAPSLVAMTTSQVPIVAWEERYMTAQECARLQSLDGLRYLPMGEACVTALGNAVNVRVAQLVLRSMLQVAGVRRAVFPKTNGTGGHRHLAYARCLSGAAARPICNGRYTANL